MVPLMPVGEGGDSPAPQEGGGGHMHFPLDISPGIGAGGVGPAGLLVPFPGAAPVAGTGDADGGAGAACASGGVPWLPASVEAPAGARGAEASPEEPGVTSESRDAPEGAGDPAGGAGDAAKEGKPDVDAEASAGGV